MNSTPPELELSRAAPAGVRQLFWDVFFASRGRGVSLDAHFPWLADSASTRCVALVQGQDVLAALALRQHPLAGAESIGLIGLVCVREADRGRGLSRQLLEAAAALARDLGLTDLLLWTTKPEVYASVGFKTEEQEQFVQVSAPPSSPPPHAPTPSAFEGGLPAFATAARTWTANGARITTLDGPSGATLADWSGEWRAVFELIGAALPSDWSVNLPARSPLMDELTRRGYRSTARPGAWRMRMHVGSGPAAALPFIPLLDRI